VTVSREGKGGIRVYVLELGGGASRGDVQKVTVKLKPLLSGEERRELYRAADPERWQRALEASVQHLLKGEHGAESLHEELGPEPPAR
jgi:hypothetical protein